MSVITTLEAELGFIVADLKRLFSRAIAATPPSTVAQTANANGPVHPPAATAST